MKWLALTLVMIAMFAAVQATPITHTEMTAASGSPGAAAAPARAVWLKGADLDGDGKTDLVVYRPTTNQWFVRYSSSNYSYATWTSYQWGLAGDVPM